MSPVSFEVSDRSRRVDAEVGDCDRVVDFIILSGA